MPLPVHQIVCRPRRRPVPFAPARFHPSPSLVVPLPSRVFRPAARFNPKRIASQSQRGQKTTTLKGLRPCAGQRLKVRHNPVGVANQTDDYPG